MDLKGKSWIGSIYHKFEAICQEVDDFASKDTVKYVENQVQSVSLSVKRLYSVVARDVIPPLGDDLKTKAQSVTGKQDDMGYNLKSIARNMTMPNCDDEKQLPVEQDSSDVLNKCKTSRSSDLDLVMCCTKPCEHSSQEENTDVSLKQDGDTMMQNDAGDDFEEKITMVTPVNANSSSENEALLVTSEKQDHDNEDQNNITLSMSSSPELSVHDPQFLAFKQPGSLSHSFPNDTKHFSNISSTSWLSEGELPLVPNINLVENRSFSEQPEASAEKAHQYITLCMNSSTSLASDAAQSASGEDWTLHHEFLTKDQCVMVSNAVQTPELVFSYFSCDGEEAEESVISSGCSTASAAPFNLLDSTSANFTGRDENTCNTHVEYNDCVCHISNDHTCSPSSATAANDIKGVDMLPALSILEPNVSVVGSSESKHAQCCKEAQSTFLMPSSESGNSNIGVVIDDLDMETIDLSSSVKCDVMNCNIGHTTYHRQKNFRYYKKLILDAFTSRKRLSKEYEHLAICYGDIGTESDKQFAPNSLPSSPTSSAHAAKTFNSEWELL